MNSPSRYALYFAPEPGSDLDKFGADWFARVPEAPRHYGFHATLKAPFRLAAGVDIDELIDELEQFCGERLALALPALKVTLLEDFLALVPAAPDPAIQSIAAECVMRFDRFRAPLSDQDLARRRPDRLGSLELQMLRHWGYPHVLELFRFHLSLTGPLGGTEVGRVGLLSAQGGKALGSLEPPLFGSICVFEEPEPRAAFHLIRRVPFMKAIR